MVRPEGDDTRYQNGGIFDMIQAKIQSKLETDRWAETQSAQCELNV